MIASRAMRAEAARRLAEAAAPLVWYHDEARALVRRKPAHRCTGRIVSEAPARGTAYWIGENGAASTILFSCATKFPPPPLGGQMPSARALARTSARCARLS